MKFIIVLGNRNRDIMEKRVDRALEEFYSSPQVDVDQDTHDRRLLKTLLFSGGSSDGASKPEGAVMMNDFALSKGIDKEFIVTEDKSRTTVENFLHCRKILQEAFPYNHVGWWRPKVTICTSSFHIRRAMVLAKLLLPEYELSFVDTREAVSRQEQADEWLLLFRYLKHMCDQEFAQTKFEKGETSSVGKQKP